MNNLVSIVVPVYNVEEYLMRCVDSLTAQTYKNIEIILVDDGSTDKSGDICDYYEREDMRVRVLHQNNGGQSKARNEALKIARGDYYCFIDSDDYVPCDYVEKLYNLLKDNDADLSMCEFTMFTGERADGAFDNPKESVVKEYDNVELIKNMHTISGELYVVMWGKLFKKELVTGIQFPEGRICEDLAVLYKMYDRVKKAVYCNDIMYYYYRNNKNSSTYNINKKFYDDVFMALEEEIAYMESNRRELLEYPKKTYMYWLFDYYKKLYNNHEKVNLAKLHNRYKKMYREVKNLPKEKFYTVFYYAPSLYLRLKH